MLLLLGLYSQYKPNQNTFLCQCLVSVISLMKEKSKKILLNTKGEDLTPNLV